MYEMKLHIFSCQIVDILGRTPEIERKKTKQKHL